ncbi:MAG TPA: hypothetical protein VFX15_13600 [Actinomycetes bacterium]|nr:hypothetical protein [Actinomycetes bacterium]
MTTSGAEGKEALGVQVRLLSVLVLVEAIAMVLFVVLDVVSALRAADAEWGAVWFVLVVMGSWAAGLVAVSRGVLSGSRWSFTPTLLTQVLFGVAAVSFFGAAEPLARVIWGVVLVYAIVVLRLLFSRPVREHLVYDNA